MPEIEEEAIFISCCHALRLITGVGNDKLIVENLQLDAETAASIAWMINQPEPVPLRFKISIAEQEG